MNRFTTSYMSVLLHIILWAAILFACQPIAGQSKGKANQDPEQKSEPVKPGNAWTLSYPLGLHEESTIDTLLYNYQQRNIPSMQSDAWASTGNLGAEGINMIFFDRAPRSQFFFTDALSAWMPSFRTRKFYNVYVPTTLLSYNFGGNKLNHQDRLDAVFAGNVNRRIGVGANVDYLYSKGCYEAQATKDLSFGLEGYYTGDRYEMQAFFNHFNFLNKENGGITDDLYITDPAVLQGGVDKIEAKSIPVRLSAAHNRITGNQFYMSHAYKVGFWKDNPDANPADSLNQEIYVPVTKFIYSMKYEGAHHHFINTNSSQGHNFWENFYLNPGKTDDDTRYWALTNTVGVSMIEGFQTWAKFGLSAYASYQIRKFTQDNFYQEEDELTEEQLATLTPLPTGVDITPRVNQNLLWVGGRIEKTRGSLLRYNADARFGLVGDAVGEVEIGGRIDTRFRLMRDTVEISVHGHFHNNEAPYLLRNYISNHFVWKNDFGKIRSVKVGGELFIPWTDTRISAGVENLQNYIYFDDASLPRQHDGNIQVLSASLTQKLHFGIWNWNNTLTYQTSSDKEIIPLPALSIYSNMFLGFTAFKVLHLQLGIDCNYYTRYTPYNYQPATMTFCRQNPDDAVQVGNYPFCNLYATAKLYKVRFYVMLSHVNQGIGSKNYFALPHYPMNPRLFQLGLSIDFAN